MQENDHRSRSLPLLTACWLFFVGAVLVATVSGPDLHAQGKARIMGPDKPRSCVQCHAWEVKAWEKTHHKASDEVFDDDKAEEIAEKMGLEDGPDETALCQGCHVTMYAAKAGDEPEPEYGVTCESCHGAAEHWITIHSNVGKDVKTSKDEAPEHRQDRIAQCETAGMIFPFRVHRLASNCFGCHTVPNEKLVNTGGHPAGSAEFELFAWSQGEVRHNFLFEQNNPDPTKERARLLYVVGRVTDLEFGLRGLAKATVEGAYSKAMMQRIDRAKKAVGKLRSALGDSDAGKALQAALDAAPADQLKVGNAAALGKAAEAVKEQAVKLADAGGSKLGAVEGMLPGSYRGTVFKHQG